MSIMIALNKLVIFEFERELRNRRASMYSQSPKDNLKSAPFLWNIYKSCPPTLGKQAQKKVELRVAKTCADKGSQLIEGVQVKFIGYLLETWIIPD